ncbi:protein ALP1-like [Trichonephila clavipes]|nr:protein ALP1-like [Trichonephila clavipes]
MSLFNSPNSSHIFNDSEISDDDGDLNILKSSRRTYSKARESEKSFCTSTTNTKSIASSSLFSCENDSFIDGNIHSEPKKTHESKKMNNVPHISLFDNEEDKCSDSGCDFSNKLLSPTFPNETYHRTRKNLKRKVIKNELNLEPKTKHPSSNMLLKSVHACNQENYASLSMNIKVKLDDSKVNVQHSPSLHEGNRKRSIVKKEIKTNASSYDRHLPQNSNNEINMLDFVRSYSVEQNLEYINSRKSEVSKTPEGSKISNAKKLTHGLKSSTQRIVPKSTGAEKGCNKSKGRQKSNNKSKEGQKSNDKSKERKKSNNTVVENSTTKHKLIHGNFKQIKRPDIDKHSMQKPLQRSYDESKSGFAVPHSSPLPPFVTHSTEIKDSTECVQVAQSNTRRVNSLEAKLKYSCNHAFNNACKELGILRHNLMQHTTVKDCFSHPDAHRALSKLCYENFHSEDSESYRRFLQMDVSTFEELVALVSPSIERKNTSMRKAIPAAERIALTLRYLATGETQSSLSYQFRIAQNAISGIIPAVCAAIYHHLGSEIQVPESGNEWKMVDVGTNGRVSDGGVWGKSKLRQAITNGDMNIPEAAALPGSASKLPFVIVADDAFPLMPNIMKPYPGSNLSKECLVFNYRLSGARRVSENAFGILAARFRVFGTTILTFVPNTKLIVLAACSLHNFLTNRSKNTYIPEDCADRGYFE